MTVGIATADVAPIPGGATPCAKGSAPMAKVELYFGIGHGAAAAWPQFLRNVVTPRFPDGLTTWTASGQWRGARGLQREAARVVVIVYRPDASSDQRIDAIRALYKRRFRQTSVLRVDTSACVGF